MDPSVAALLGRAREVLGSHPLMELGTLSTLADIGWQLLTSASPWQWAIAFLALFITDICWAFYVNATAGRSPFSAANWAVALFLLGGIAVVSYTTNPILLIPSAAGAWAGTVAGVWWNHFKEKRSAAPAGALAAA